MMKHLITAFLLVVLTGCAGLEAKGPVYTEAPKPSLNSETAIVYFYRIDGISNFMGEKQIYIDGKKLLSLPDKAFTWIQTGAEKIEISAETPWSMRPLDKPYNPPSLSLELEKGREYFVSYRIRVDSYSETPQVTMVGNIPIVGMAVDSETTELLLTESKSQAMDTIPYLRYEAVKE